MHILKVDKAVLSFGINLILNKISFNISAKQRVGLIGQNGCGKSSLLRAINGDLELDGGNIWIAPTVKIGRVTQHPVFCEQHTVFEAVAEGLGGLQKILLDYHLIANKISCNEMDTDSLMGEMQDLQNKIDVQNGWQYQSNIEKILSRLKLDCTLKISNLSGGWLKRVALARALVSNPDLLLLDEPTNYLDFDMINWLEEELLQFHGSLLFITHDRRFLDKLASRIIELDRGNISEFDGNFAQYQQKKQDNLLIESTHLAKFDKVLTQEEAWIRRGIKARRTRNEGRVRRLEQLRLDRANRLTRNGKVKIRLDSSVISGKLVAEMKNVSKFYSDKIVVKDFSANIVRGDRIGLLGPNGVGKTTLLKLIIGDLQPDNGTIRRGTNISIAYFDQMREQLQENDTLVEAISPGSEFIEIGGKRTHVVSYLEHFLFSPQRLYSPVRTLSGGEKNRLLLARLFARPANVLILDEPTNDLDIDTLNLLEKLLQEFDGTLFLVSHDREFLENTVTQLMIFAGDGIINEFIGGYDDWKVFNEQAVKHNKQSYQVENKQTFNTNKRNKKNVNSNKLSFKQVKELEQLPDLIESIEAEQTSINNELSNPNLYKNKSLQQIKVLQQRSSALESKLNTAMQRWELLENSG